jgi:hypothetical protein
MTNTLAKLTLISAGTILSYGAIASHPVQAATIAYDFQVSIDSGPLATETYLGFLEYDNSTLTGSGSELLPVSSVSFNFLGVVYTEADDSFGSEVEFLDGDFLGLSFSTDASFSFVPGFLELDEAVFAYDIAQGAGAGAIAYTLRSSSVPEPSAMMGLLGLVTLGASSTILCRRK